jgi:hypothetical protein
MQHGVQYQANDDGVDDYPDRSPITLTIFVGTSSVSFKSRMTIPLFRRQLCGPNVGVPGDRAIGPLTRAARLGTRTG